MPPKKRYKQYAYRDSTQQVPRSTLHEITNGKIRKRPGRPLSVSKSKSVKEYVRAERTQDKTQPVRQDEQQPPPQLQSECANSDPLWVLSCDDIEPAIEPNEWEIIEDNDNEISDDNEDEDEEAAYGEENEDSNMEMDDFIDIGEVLEIEVGDKESENHSSDDEEEILTEDPNSHLSIEEQIKMLLLLATKKRHNLTYSAAVNIMRLAGLFARDSSCFLPSKHRMKTIINFFSSAVTEHHMCPGCQMYIGIVHDFFVCSNCGKEGDAASNKKCGNIFLYISLHDQFKCLFEYCLSDSDIVNPNARDKINQFNYEDIYDGRKYKTSVNSGEISFNFFVDGVQVATTSKKAAWPVLLVINELPLQLRGKYVLMASLWLGLKKPLMNEYLKPFVKECKELATSGVSFEKNCIIINRKIKALMGVSDSIARPLLRNSKQFNGRFGCGLCYHPGIKIRFGRGKVRSYSISQNVYPIRTHCELMNHARLAEARREPQHGIKGLSVLAELPDFDMVDCLDLDLFHALVNTAKRFCNLWFNKKYRGMPYFVGGSLAVVNARLLSITPTGDVSRAPRSLYERSDYRGHEWYYWVIVYSIPCLKNILPQRFLNHWSLLVHALAIIMQNSVAKTEVVYADRYIHEFVSKIDNLYGRPHVTFSIHLLTHLRRSIENFGQPWTHSAFIFESFNCDIKNAVKSSNGAAIQICESIRLKEALKTLNVILSDKMNEQQRTYLESITTSKKLAQPYQVVGPAQLLGKPFQGGNNKYVRAMSLLGVKCDINDMRIFERCFVFNEIFHGTIYKKAPKQCNSMALLESGQFFQVESFIVVSNQCFCIGFFYENDKRHLCSEKLPHIVVLKERSEGVLRAVNVLEIQCKLLSFCVELEDNVLLRLAIVNVLKSEMLC